MQVLPRENLEEVLRPGMTIQLLGNRHDQQLAPGPSRWQRLLGGFRELAARSIATCLGWAGALPRILGLFVQSLVAKKPPDRPKQRVQA